MSLCSELDQIWDNKLLVKFFRRYPDVPKIIEARDIRDYRVDMELLDKII